MKYIENLQFHKLIIFWLLSCVFVLVILPQSLDAITPFAFFMILDTSGLSQALTNIYFFGIPVAFFIIMLAGSLLLVKFASEFRFRANNRFQGIKKVLSFLLFLLSCLMVIASLYICFSLRIFKFINLIFFGVVS